MEDSETMNAVNSLMEPISKLPEKEFNAAIETITLLGLGTMIATRGKKFTKGFVKGSMNDTAPPIVANQTAH